MFLKIQEKNQKYEVIQASLSEKCNTYAVFTF